MPDTDRNRRPSAHDYRGSSVSASMSSPTEPPSYVVQIKHDKLKLPMIENYPTEAEAQARLKELMDLGFDGELVLPKLGDTNP